MLLAEKSPVQGMPWGSQQDGLFEAHKGAKEGARTEVKIRRKGQEIIIFLSGLR